MKTIHGIFELLTYFEIVKVANMIPSNWKKAEYIFSTGKKKSNATAMLKA